MLVFGHVGITVGVAALAAEAQKRVLLSRVNRNERVKSSLNSSQVAGLPGNNPGHEVSWLAFLVNQIDLRVLILGSLLPDVIDKPIGTILFSSGQMFCHTLFFLIVISLSGIYIWRSRRQTWLFILSFGTLMHLILDMMWLKPQILLWPMHGWGFPKREYVGYLQNIWHALLTMPEVYIPEIIGAVILVWLTLELVRRRRIFAFIKFGKV